MSTRIIALLILEFLPWSFMAQGVAKLGSVSLQIGEQTELIYSFKIDRADERPTLQASGQKLTAFRSKQYTSFGQRDSIAIDIIRGFRDTILSDQRETYWAGEYIITFWDTGYFVLPPPKLRWNDSIYELNPILVHVQMPVVEPQKEMYDIREEFVPLPFHFGTWLKTNWILVTLIVLALAGIAGWWVVRKRARRSAGPVARSIEDNACLAIDALVSSRLWEKESPKRYYSELSFILRSYLSAKFELQLLEKTSHETLLLLGQRTVHPAQLKAIEIVLNQSDFVKFAQSTPNETHMQQIADTAKAIVTNLGKTSNYGA